MNQPIVPAPGRIGGWWKAYAILIGLGWYAIFYRYATWYWLPEPLNGVYTQAPFVLAICAWLVWRQRGLLKDRIAGGAFWGLAILIAGVALKAHGEWHGYAVLRGASLIPVLLGLLMWHLPWSSTRAFLFPLAYLVFVIPLPTFVIQSTTLTFQEWSTTATMLLLPPMGFPLERSGFILQTPTLAGDGVHEIILSEGCSGLRSFFSIMAILALYLHLRPISGRAKLFLLALATPLTVIGNVLRIVSTILLTRHADPALAEGFFHEVSGFLLFAGVLAALALVERLAGFRAAPTPTTIDNEEAESPHPLYQAWRGVPALMLLLVVVAATLTRGVERATPTRTLGLIERIPTTIGDWRFSPARTELRGPLYGFVNELFEGIYQNPAGETVYLTVEFGSDFRRRHELHLPDVCHRARGDEILSLPALEVPLNTGATLSVNLLEWNRPEGLGGALCAWWLVLDGQATSDVYRLKWNQLVAGLSRTTQTNLLVRIDIIEEGPRRPNRTPELTGRIVRFIRHLEINIDTDLHADIFGTGHFR